MTLIQSIILGIVQGATEFIPVSSSGHLVLVPYIFSWEIPAQEAFIFDILVQVATLAAVFAYFWNDLISIATATLQGILKRKPFQEQNSRLGWYLVLATIPAGIAALLFKDTLEEAFSNPKWAAFFLLGTAIMLIIAEQFKKRTRPFEEIAWLDALWIGLFQVLALFPGVSRSGAT
ncbi:MAG: undecaprenyl-diphosphatase, partial [Chloroflexota bacterium]